MPLLTYIPSGASAIRPFTKPRAANVKGLDTRERIRLARTLKTRYDSSVKQITRLTGLVYDEVKDLF